MRRGPHAAQRAATRPKALLRVWSWPVGPHVAEHIPVLRAAGDDALQRAEDALRHALDVGGTIAARRRRCGRENVPVVPAIATAHKVPGHQHRTGHSSQGCCTRRHHRTAAEELHRDTIPTGGPIDEYPKDPIIAQGAHHLPHAGHGDHRRPLRLALALDQAVHAWRAERLGHHVHAAGIARGRQAGGVVPEPEMAGHKDDAFAGLQPAIDVFPALDPCAPHDLGGRHVR